MIRGTIFQPLQFATDPVIDRVYIDDSLEQEILLISGPEAHHLARVRRAQVGDRVEVFDGRGTAFEAVIDRVERDRVTVRRMNHPLPDRKPVLAITLATAIPRGERFDWLVEKSVELGVERLVPVRFARSVVDPGQGKLDRTRRAIIEASKQCGRNMLMRIEPPIDWAGLLQQLPGTDRLIAHPGAPQLSTMWRGKGPVTIAIGPEGGLTDRELEEALAAGWRPFGLGSIILRIETAAIASCAAVLAMANGGAAWGPNPSS
jgi:16S rRNA (uracil1498-N3)-methyltransferase